MRVRARRLRAGLAARRSAGRRTSTPLHARCRRSMRRLHAGSRRKFRAAEAPATSVVRTNLRTPAFAGLRADDHAGTGPSASHFQCVLRAQTTALTVVNDEGGKPGTRSTEGRTPISVCDCRWPVHVRAGAVAAGACRTCASGRQRVAGQPLHDTRAGRVAAFGVARSPSAWRERAATDAARRRYAPRRAAGTRPVWRDSPPAQLLTVRPSTSTATAVRSSALLTARA